MAKLDRMSWRYYCDECKHTCDGQAGNMQRHIKTHLKKTASDDVDIDEVARKRTMRGKVKVQRGSDYCGNAALKGSDGKNFNDSPCRSH